MPTIDSYPHVSVTEARASLTWLLQQLSNGGAVVLTSHAKVRAVLYEVPRVLPDGLRVSVPEARNRFSEIIEQVATRQVLLTLRDEVQACLCSPEVFEAMCKTGFPLVNVLRERPVRRVMKVTKTKIVTFWNEAGGATKTSMVAELGYLLSKRQGMDGEPCKVLLIDLDPQRSLTHRMGILDRVGSQGVLFNQSCFLIMQSPNEAFPVPLHPERMPELSVIPAHTQLRVLDGALLSDDEMMGHFAVSLRAHAGQYDFIFIDTPPSNGGLTRAALLASDYAVIPCATHIKSLENVENVATVLGWCKKRNPALELAMFVPTSFNSRRVHDRMVMQRLLEQFSMLAPIASPIMERMAQFRDVLPMRGAVALDFPKSEAVNELNVVLDELLARIEPKTGLSPASYQQGEVNA